jgi:hypothetical protein
MAAGLKSRWTENFENEVNSHMKQEELIAKAREYVGGFEKNSTDLGVSVALLPKVRLRDAVVVYFESSEHDGKIEVYLDKESGEFITATFVPVKGKA